MSNPCDCKNEVTLLQDVLAQCPAVVNETVCVQALVTITPDVQTGEIRSFCVGNPMIGNCPGTPSTTGDCSFTVSQRICVQVPLTFSAGAVAEPTGIVCGMPDVGECQPTDCTYTIGFYRNNPELTNALITDAGGIIILGVDAQGASFTVTTANAGDVLSFNTPSPPAPGSPPFASQYQILYAQLLAANLNLLRGATCPFVLEAISIANAFLAASPSGVGMAGASEIQEPLALFNEGNAPGCLTHCPN